MHCLLYLTFSDVFQILAIGQDACLLRFTAKSSCFSSESFPSRDVWAMYLRCCFLQKLAMLEVFVIVVRRSLLNIYDQSRSLGTAVSASSLLVARR